jgi:hypothetical protein
MTVKTVNFEYTEYYSPLHPHATAIGEYSVFADVSTGLDADGEEVISVVFTSIRFKVCSFISEGEWEPLNIPGFGNNPEINKMLSIFTSLVIEKHDELKAEQRENQTA